MQIEQFTNVPFNGLLVFRNIVFDCNLHLNGTAALNDWNISSENQIPSNECHRKLYAHHVTSSQFARFQNRMTITIYKVKLAEWIEQRKPNWTKWIHADKNLMTSLMETQLSRFCHMRLPYHKLYNCTHIDYKFIRSTGDSQSWLMSIVCFQTIDFSP